MSLEVLGRSENFLPFSPDGVKHLLLQASCLLVLLITKGSLHIWSVYGSFLLDNVIMLIFTHVEKDSRI
jgi:hypothetical protein